jgi:uncharacterized protein YcnI
MQARHLYRLAIVSYASVLPAVAAAHNFVAPAQAPAGYVQDLAMRVPHGCKGSPVKQVRIKIPEDVYRVTVDYRDDWDIELKMRKVDPPVSVEVGPPITETVDEVIWSNPANVLPPDRVGEFRFRAKLPNEPGRILFFRTLNACEEGDDNYIDLPEMTLDVKDPAFHEKFWAFMTATATPAPYVFLTKPERPQYPWEWADMADRAHLLAPSDGALAAD